jgi:hypothetical protein
METNMTEELLKIRAEELTTIRLVFANKVVHEIPMDRVAEHAGECQDDQLKRHLLALAQALRFFSSKKTDPSIEFVVPAQQSRIELSQPLSTFARH